MCRWQLTKQNNKSEQKSPLGNAVWKWKGGRMEPVADLQKSECGLEKTLESVEVTEQLVRSLMYSGAGGKRGVR